MRLCQVAVAVTGESFLGRIRLQAFKGFKLPCAQHGSYLAHSMEGIFMIHGSLAILSRNPKCRVGTLLNRSGLGYWA